MKILPTVGPITQDLSSLKYLSSKYEFIRLNGAHNSIEWHIKISKILKRFNPNLKILIDIPGIKPRTQNVNTLSISKNEKIIFYYGRNKIDNKFKSVKISNPIPTLKNNIRVFSISDGQFLFKISSIQKNLVVGQSIADFKLKPGKGVNFIGSTYDDKRQSKKYLNFLKSLDLQYFDAVGLSFVQNEKIINKVKNYLSNKIIISKIENVQGMKNLDSIVFHSDSIMIDKGDLSAEIGESKLYDSISEIVTVCKKFGKPIISATENLDSMIERRSPTKSEIVAIGHSKDIGIDMMMLSDETATSKNWKNTLRWLEVFLLKKSNYEISRSYENDENFIKLIQNIKSIPVVVFTKKGFVIEKISKINLEIPLYVFTDSHTTYTACNIRNNTKCFIVKKFPKLNFSYFIQSHLKSFAKQIFKNSKVVLLLHISFPNKSARADTIRLVNVKDLI